jgi:hypothetical protein
MSAHPAQIRDAVQNYIEQAYRPVMRFHVQKAVTDRLDTYFGAVASQMRNLELDGKIAKYVSPEGTEFWYSPKSQSFCGTCGQLALPGVHPDPACNRHQPAPGGTPTATTGMTEVNPDQAATLIHYAVQAADGEAQLNPPPDGETPGDYTRRLVTAAVLHLVEQGLLVIPTDLERRIAEPIPADRQAARRTGEPGWTWRARRDLNPQPSDP